MTMTTRIYKVTDSEAEVDEHPQLVRASTPAQAIGHVVRTRYAAQPASQEDLEKLLGAGVKVQKPA